ncbi:MAG: EAL domain-containing protein, partial [bacterium]
TIRSHIDHLELQAARSALRAREELLLKLLDSSSEPIAYIHEGMHIHANRAYLELFGYESRDELEGMPLMDMVPDYEQQHLKVLLNSYQDSYELTESARIDISLPSGSALARLDLSPAEFDGENCMQLVVHLLTPTQSLSGQFDYLAIYDVASGLYTRNHLLDQLESHIDSGEEDEQSALVLLQIDGFDALEQQLGHANAHLLYTEIAAQLKSRISLDDILSRYENSSFGLLLTRPKGVSVDDFMQDMMAELNGTVSTIGDAQIPCKLTAGVSLLQPGTIDAQELVAHAEESLSLAIDHHVSYLLHEPTVDTESQRELDQTWAAKLRSAITEERFQLVFQPIINLRQDEAPASYDIMLRMEEPDGSFITPSEFLASAERTGLASGLDRWVVINALKAVEREHARDPATRFNIKLTEDSVCNPDSLEWIKVQLQTHKIDTRKITFEAKSSVLINHMVEVQSMIDVLAPLGCRFCLDNFDGMLDIAQLLDHLQVHYLRLDAKCLHSRNTVQANLTSLQALTQRAHKLGKEVVVKNIESNEQFTALEHIDIDHGQGNFLYPPSPTLDLTNHNTHDLTLSNPQLISLHGILS